MKNDRICPCTAWSQLRARTLEDSRSEGRQLDSRKLMKCLADFRQPPVQDIKKGLLRYIAENQALLEEKACQQFEINL